MSDALINYFSFSPNNIKENVIFNLLNNINNITSIENKNNDIKKMVIRLKNNNYPIDYISNVIGKHERKKSHKII